MNVLIPGKLYRTKMIVYLNDVDGEPYGGIVEEGTPLLFLKSEKKNKFSVITLFFIVGTKKLNADFSAYSLSPWFEEFNEC